MGILSYKGFPLFFRLGLKVKGTMSNSLSIRDLSTVSLIEHNVLSYDKLHPCAFLPD